MITLNYPKVSVIITCYNYEKFVREAIESVLNQEFQDFEIIFINDGSTDKSAEIVKDYIASGKIIYLEQENKGQTSAKNEGVKRARGKFLAFLDADDAWEKEKLTEQLQLFSNPEVGVVYSASKNVDVNGNQIGVGWGDGFFTPRRGKITEFLIFENFIPFSSGIIRRECFEKVGNFNEHLKMGIDWDLWLRISINYYFDFVDKPLIRYRIGHPGQMSRRTEERLDSAMRIMANFLAEHPEVIKKRISKKALSYAFCSRGKYYQDKDIIVSDNFFKRAVKEDIFMKWAYLGLLENRFMRIIKRGRKIER